MDTSCGRTATPRCTLVTLAVVALLVTPVVATLPAGAGHGGLHVQDLNHGTTAANLVSSLVGGGVAVSNVTYMGANNAAGSFTGGAGIIGFESGIVLGSGSVQTDANTGCEDPGKGVEGPNACDNVTTDNDRPGDPQLTALAGEDTLDAAILEFDFVPQFPTVQFRYVFSSDEYNEWVNSGFNDVFAFYVNGTNCATVPGSGQPVSINTINGGDPFGTDATNPTLYRNNDPDDPGPATINTEMDGLTVVLECNATVNPGVSNHMKLAIADASDSALDSNVFLEGGSLVSGTQISTSLSGGGQTGTAITVPAGTAVTDSATLSGVNAANAGGTVTYTVYSDPACTTVFANAGTKTVTSGTVPNSDQVTFNTGGTFYWRAAYSGDAANNAATSPCGEETVTVTGGSTTSSSSTTPSSSTSSSSTTSLPSSSTSSTSVPTSSTSTTVPTSDGCVGLTPTIVGTGGDDIIVGTPGPDVIDGREGDDMITGFGGGDVVCGGPGHDAITGDNGDDDLRGGPGNDSIHGGRGKDTIAGHDGNDDINGANHDDTIVGNAGDDEISGGSENDAVAGGEGNDALNGGIGDDRVQGGGGDDQIKGNVGNDILEGDPGRDLLQATDGVGADSLTGGPDPDRCYGDPGDTAASLSGGDC